MQKLIKGSIVVMLLSLSLFSCTKKDNPETTPDPIGNGTVKLEFANKVGSGKLILNDQWYINEHGDSFKVSKLSYYISNIKLNNAAAVYAENESYHLIEQEKSGSRSFDLANVPYGTYKSITLTIGVDSLRNVSGAQTGALDPANEMFWAWSTGYIMLRFEGISPKAPTIGKRVTFEIGGFAGPNATQRTVTLDYPTPITVSKDGENHIHLDADVLKLFKSPNVVDFSYWAIIHLEGAGAKMIADNYANMLSVSYSGL